MRKKKSFGRCTKMAGVVGLGLAVAPGWADEFQFGDIFAAVGNGQIQWYRSDGSFVQTLNTGHSGLTAGMAFDRSGNLYATAFSANRLVKFDSSGALLHPDYAFGVSNPGSVVFDQFGNFYVGNRNNGIRKYDAAGEFLGTVIGSRIDGFDLSANQGTFLYAQDGNAVRTVSNDVPGLSGPDFATGLHQASALRYLPDGGVLVADLENVKRFDSAGVLTQTYDITGEDTWFSLNLNPDGNSFWSGNFVTGLAYEFTLEGDLTQTLDVGARDFLFFGLAVFGERTAGGPPPQSRPPRVPDGGATSLLLGLGLIGLGWARRGREGRRGGEETGD